MSSETTTNIARGIQTDFKLLAAASGNGTDFRYSKTDVAISDPTAHKGISTTAADQNLQAGSCNPRTALGVDRGTEPVINLLETAMSMEQLFRSFILAVDKAHMRETVSLTSFIGMILMIFYDTHEYITNKLSLPFIRIVLVGLISPFFAKTISDANHTQLQKYFMELYDNLINDEIDSSFFDFKQPFFGGISSRLFNAIKNGSDYRTDVVSAITMSFEHTDV